MVDIAEGSDGLAIPVEKTPVLRPYPEQLFILHNLHAGIRRASCTEKQRILPSQKPLEQERLKYLGKPVMDAINLTSQQLIRLPEFNGITCVNSEIRLAAIKAASAQWPARTLSASRPGADPALIRSGVYTRARVAGLRLARDSSTNAGAMSGCIKYPLNALNTPDSCWRRCASGWSGHSHRRCPSPLGQCLAASPGQLPWADSVDPGKTLPPGNSDKDEISRS